MLIRRSLVRAQVEEPKIRKKSPSFGAFLFSGAVQIDTTLVATVANVSPNNFVRLINAATIKFCFLAVKLATLFLNKES
jgi:hypothetical protein